MDSRHTAIGPHDLSDDELLCRTRALLRSMLRDEADLVAHIGEIDARRLYARFGVSSMFGYCTQILHLSEHEAYLRITAARAARSHPMLLDMLRDGRLHLATVARLAGHLTAENCDAVLARAVHRSKREVEELVAELSPRADAPAAMRKLPDRRPSADAAGLESRGQDAFVDAVMANGSGGIGLQGAGRTATADGRRLDSSGVVAPGTDAAGRRDDTPRGQRVPERVGLRPAARPAEGRRSQIEALAPARYRVQFTASAELRDKLERLQALVRSSVDDADLVTAIDVAVTEALARRVARRFGGKPRVRPGQQRAGAAPDELSLQRTTAAPPAPAGSRQGPSKPQVPIGRQVTAELPVCSRAVVRRSATPSRHIPAAVRRAVDERDRRQCRYVDEQGRRCSARSGLEFHHRHPYGHGGGHTAENVSLLCRSHNRYLAEVDYGRERMGTVRPTAAPLPPAAPAAAGPPRPPSPPRSPG